MYFIDKRIQVICDQLKALRIRDSRELPNWQYKRGLFRPEEAEKDGQPWQNFDCKRMHWYSVYDGSDDFEGKFEGYQGDFKGIQGEHYWFRGNITIPEEMAGKSVWMKIRTQIEEWDDGKNPQFLVFVDGKVTQGADMNHRDIQLFAQAPVGQTLTVDIQAYTGTLHREFHFLVDLYVLDEAINHLYYDLQVPLWAFSRMDPDDKTRLDIQTVLNHAVNLLDMRTPCSPAFYASVEKARAYLAENLYEKMGGHPHRP